jgi:photosynthetic reaction center H subunit
MPTGAITGYIDVAQLTLYAFWIFFFGLIYYLRQEDKREGYPLEDDRPGRMVVQGFPPVPVPKTFRLWDGSTVTAPRAEPPTWVNAVPLGPWPGAPLEPVGDPMLSALGPGAYANRAEVPEMLLGGEGPKIVPLRVAHGYFVDPEDPDPRGMTVVSADRIAVGTVRDIWVDRSEVLVRFLEVELSAAQPTDGVTAAPTPRVVLLPINFAELDPARGCVTVSALMARNFADVPGVQSADQITLREEDRITGYYAAGTLYATPSRAEPLI